MMEAITPNFEAIRLQYDPSGWVLHFYLKLKDDEDIEEANDMVDTFAAYLTDSKDVISGSIYLGAESAIHINEDSASTPDSIKLHTLFRMRD